MLRIVTPPAGLPLSVEEARAHVRQDLTIDDLLLEGAIRACAEFAQTECQRTLLGTRYSLTLDSLAWTRLYMGPVRQVVSVRYRDTSGAWQVLDPSQYTLDPAGELIPAPGVCWPCTYAYGGSVAEIVYDAGDAAPVVASAAGDTITVRGPWAPLAVDDAVRLHNSGGALPAPLAADTDYYVQTVVAPGVYRLAEAPGGPAIDLTDAGSGNHYIGQPWRAVLAWMLLRIGSHYANREAESDFALHALPYIDRMLDPAREVLA